MILVELDIENYKQYAGKHLIEFPSEGAVAIIGNNGVGKTTLFEAIEWCLYNPREIPNDELPPRGGVGDTRVKLVLEDPRDQVRYVIERIRRRRGVDAEIYLQEQEDVPIVKGTRDVTEYVKQRLIGLSHRAFVSTFFTRQKELSFFGDLRDTERRREVAQLLGFETIRTAQGIIGDDRTVARNDYQALARQYEDEINERDLAAELTRAETAINLATTAEHVALREVEASDIAHQATRQELERWTALERQFAAFSQDIERLGGELRTAQANQRNAESNLDRLTKLDQDRLQLVPSLQAEPALQNDLLIHKANRERFLRAQSLDEAVKRAQTAMEEISPRAQRVVRSIDTAGIDVDGWRWSKIDDGDLEATLDRLLGTVDRLDPACESRRAESLRNLTRAIAARDEARTKAVRYQKRLDEVRRDLKHLLDENDPQIEITGIEARRTTAREAEHAAITAGRQGAARQAEVEQTIAAIAAAAKEPECPTCHRPLSPQDAEIAIAPLRVQIADFAALQRALQIEAETARAQIAQADHDLRPMNERLVKLKDLEQRLATGEHLVVEAAADANLRDDECGRLLADLKRATYPSLDEAREAGRRAETIRAISNQRSVFINLRDQLSQATADRANALEEIETLGPVTYDPAEHKTAEEALDSARTAIARLAQIDQELAHRPNYQSQRTTAEAIAARVAQELSEAEERRTFLEFDRGELDRAAEAERTASTRAREADRAVAAARGRLQAAVRDRDTLLVEQERVANLARRSEIRRREHDELDRMYREFGRFDQYVAQLVTPQLADYTGELLAEVTDHTYDQVVFDDNYGVRIFDGPEDFPIDQFSGGERDVAALCARLALSRFIGAQAAHPPRFLVLDEVFGSLDADRRAQVLSALLKLAGNDGPFRQLFIISHVDDVRASTSFDEVWRVHEIDGASKVENLSRSGNAEDL